MEKTGWKTTAIIFIILFILETTFLVWVIVIGEKSIDKENECIFNVCSEGDSFSYDSVNEYCYCYKLGEKDYYLIKYLG